MEALIPIVSVLTLFIGLPGIIFMYKYKSKKNQLDLEKLEHQKDILELEIEKEKLQLKVLEEENRKLDRQITEK
ncbi:hypothetical protein [Breznakiella homolactica]|uniref:Phage shock protein B n=1 Tax=Breznakiella homolactica TaxID=2798577 RepID=A0A7T7XNE7_9SPIR|nr:hypothetical protein [Breznakiella homolactica]QQO09462.1 hypothetical protein JFL75_00635 [Breznakiella homolactica]